MPNRTKIVYVIIKLLWRIIIYLIIPKMKLNLYLKTSTGWPKVLRDSGYFTSRSQSQPKSYGRYRLYTHFYLVYSTWWSSFFLLVKTRWSSFFFCHERDFWSTVMSMMKQLNRYSFYSHGPTAFSPLSSKSGYSI